jgi:polyisoprenoid-binding protein YceI
LDVVAEGFVKDPWGNEKAGFHATGSINRKEFGLAWNVALETGGVLVGDEVKLNLEIELTRQKGE